MTFLSYMPGPARRTPVTLAFGDPIHVPKSHRAKPSEEEVDAFHRRLVQGFVDVFDTHKAAFGWAHKRLKVV